MRDPAALLHQLSAAGLLRTLRPLDSAPGPRIVRDGAVLNNFASNDYLGLAGHPAVKAAFIDGVARFGAGSTASRLVSGTLPPHQRLEEALAAAKHTEAALTFSSGFAAAIGAIPAIVGKGDTVILDKLCHASLVDAARLSGANLRVFPHNHLPALARLLRTTRAKSPSAVILVLTESVFSMDGDLCPLARILELTEAHDALLLLDEAHAIGLLGESGMGLADHPDLHRRVTFHMGTLSKVIGLSGGYIATTRAWADLLINRARSFIYSTAPPAAIAHAALRSLEIILSPEGARLRRSLHQAISAIAPGHPTPIIPKILGPNEAALRASALLAEKGHLVPAIRYPTVPRGSARLRISLSAAHSPEIIRTFAADLATVLPAAP